MNYTYNHLVLGGTFDLLHIGHMDILSQAFNLAKFVTIGITTDKFNIKRHKASFQTRDLRVENLRLYLAEKNLLKRSRIVLIEDIFGTTLTDSKLEAIIVSKATESVARLINRKRILSGLKKLDIITIPFTKGEDGKIVSSSRIRSGEINPSGESYKDILLKIAGKKLPEAARKKLKKPLGPLISLPSSNSLNTPIISVGDITTANLLKANFKPNLAIVDSRVGRKKILMDPPIKSGDDREDIPRIKNPPGQISKALILAIENALKPFPLTSLPLLIDGEEDLATIPAILLSPLGSTVYYGQPNEGLVEVKVDLKIKDYLCQILNLN